MKEAEFEAEKKINKKKIDFQLCFYVLWQFSPLEMGQNQRAGQKRFLDRITFIAFVSIITLAINQCTYVDA